MNMKRWRRWLGGLMACLLLAALLPAREPLAQPLLLESAIGAGLCSLKKKAVE